MTQRYEYMLDMPHKQSSKRKHMSRTDRAAQFGAFRALTGHEEAILETERLTDSKIELDEEQKAEIDMKLRYLLGNLEKKPEISIIYFKADEKKSGGVYIKKKGIVKKIKVHEKEIVFADGEFIPLYDIVAIDCGI